MMVNGVWRTIWLNMMIHHTKNPFRIKDPLCGQVARKRLIASGVEFSDVNIFRLTE